MKKFADLAGKAQGSGPDRYKFVEGKNAFRIVSEIVPLYKYWIKENGNNYALEALGFDRDAEKFLNMEKDWVRHYWPEKKCSWAYASFVIDRADGKLKLMDHKKTILEQVIQAHKNHPTKLPDPTNHDTGWDIIVNREKTGPKVYNVKYILDALSLSPGPLSEADREIVKSMPDIEEVLKRPTPDEQKEFIETRILNQDEDEVPEEAEEELNDLG